MKQLVHQNPPPLTLTVEEYFKSGDYRFDLVGLEAAGEKYILTVSSSGLPIFSRGTVGGIWTNNDSVRGTIKQVVGDIRCRVYVFGNLTELAEWVLKKE
jgi:hypothetical protein